MRKKSPDKRWVEVRPTSIVGIILFLGGMMGPSLLNLHDAFITWAGMFIAILGFYLMLKGRKWWGLK